MESKAGFAPTFMNRELQLEVLREVADSFATERSVDVQAWRDDKERVAALRYLEGHGLVEVRWSNDLGSNTPKPFVATATVKGLDFLADDGGLSAVLGVVTIRLHADTVRDLLLSKVDSAHDVTPEERSSLKEAIRSLPGKAMEKLTDKLLEAGADRLALEIPTLRTWIVQAAEQLLF